MEEKTHATTIDETAFLESMRNTKHEFEMSRFRTNDQLRKLQEEFDKKLAGIKKC